MFKILIVTLLFFGSANRAFAEQQFGSWAEACAAAENVVAEGDLIFIAIPNVLFQRVAEDTNTWTSHVGLVFKDKHGAWFVAESTVPLSKKTSLCDYLRKSHEHSFEIRRLYRPLTPTEIDGLRNSSNSMLNRFYGLGFNFDSKRLFCSKFVYLAYQSIGVEVGHLQTFRELLANNPDAALSFWRLWFVGSIPWERRTVTPASQLNDSKFVTVLKGV